jgi:hypothetical protein
MRGLEIRGQEIREFRLVAFWPHFTMQATEHQVVESVLKKTSARRDDKRRARPKRGLAV